MNTFAGRTAVITGAASGIGRAMADRFAREGMKIVVADIEQPALEEAERDLRQNGAEVIAVRTDVSDEAQVKQLASRAKEAFGAVHLVCNNAGVGPPLGPIWEQSATDWKWVLDVNLWGVLHGVRTFVPIMLAHGEEGHIVNTGSLAGVHAGPFLGPYNVSKFGVVALTETLFYELKVIEAKVSASVLCPGFVKTRIADAQRNRPAGSDPGSGPVSAMLAERYRGTFGEMLAKGMEPAVVADKVFDAIRSDQLYIFTHPEFAFLVPWRAQNIIEQRNPDLSVILGESAGKS